MVDEFRTSWGDVVDLDDPNTYRAAHWRLYVSTHQLRGFLWGEMGKSLIYMDYMHDPEIWEAQRKRVVGMIQDFVGYFWEAWEDTSENRLWWKKKVYRFLDEVENQC